ncbi:MAG: lipid A biosynthesis lauroyl acyltransferase, partial [bacterium]
MGSPPPPACGLDTVEISRMERLIRESPDGIRRLFSEAELADVGEGPGRAASLAARFAAKEACCKLFPRETSLGHIEPMDFSVRSDAYGAPTIELSPAAQATLDRHRIERIRLSLTHTGDAASAIAWADPKVTLVPWYGRLVYHLLPLRRGVVLENLRRVFGGYVPEPEIRRLAQAYYAHFVRFFFEFLRLPFMSPAARKAWIRIENMESPIEAHKQGKGILLMTGHFGNWEVSTVAGISQLKQYHGLLHFVRRPIKPQCLNDFITNRFARAGFGTLTRRGSLDAMLELLEAGAIVVYVFDQHAGRNKGIPVEFFGRPADTFKSLAILAMSTGAPVIPASSWREPDGSHVLRFEDPLPPIDLEDVGESIRQNTRAYNLALERMLLRHPEQWIWMHK